MNAILKSRIEFVKAGTRAATVEAARFLALGLDKKIPYKNGGKYFKEGINTDWYKDGFDSCGFVSWALLNGKGNIESDMTIQELVTTNTTGTIKINSDLYKYYDQIKVGDFAYKDSKIGLIIGKKDGDLYVAEADLKNGLIVSKITSYGESESNYTNIYFADDYYEGTGNLTNMW